MTDSGMKAVAIMKWLQRLLYKASDFLDSCALDMGEAVTPYSSRKNGPPCPYLVHDAPGVASLPLLPSEEGSDLRVMHSQDRLEETSDTSKPHRLLTSGGQGDSSTKTQDIKSFNNAGTIPQHQFDEGLWNMPAHGSVAGRNGLKDMLEHVILGARHDSSDRDPPPRCHPGTRTRILQDFDDRIRDKTTRVIWFHGPAGSGKSAIMQSLAEIQSPNVVSTALFLSGKDNPKKILTSLAYGFAIADPKYRNIIEDEMAYDPAVLSKSIDEQFKRLFIRPFSNGSITASRRWVIIIDDLDKCGSEADRCRLVDLIRDSVLFHPQSAPLLWIISSRLETHLKTSFLTVKESVVGLWEREILLDSQDALEDVELYLRAEFAKIRKAYPDLIPPSSHWLSDSDFTKLVNASSGFFSFASALIEYITGTNPVSRLRDFLEFFDGSQTWPRKLPHSQTKPTHFQPLDLMYTQIMSNVPKDALVDATSIMGYYILQQIPPMDNLNKGGLDFLTVTNILGLEQHRAYVAMRHLSSVLAYPSPEQAIGHGIRFLHPSFPEFLCDSFRSGSYHIHLGRKLQHIWRCYAKILKQTSESHTHRDIDIFWLPPGGSCSRHELQELLLQIAQHDWVEILMKCHDRCRAGSCPRASRIRLECEYNSPMKNVFRVLGSTVFDCVEPVIQQFLDWVENHAPSSHDLVTLEATSLGKISEARLRVSPSSRLSCRRVATDMSGISEVSSVDLTSIEDLVPPKLGKADAVDIDVKKTSPTPSGMVKVKEAKAAIPVTIMAIPQSEHRAVVGPISQQEPPRSVYYIFPWSQFRR